MRLISYVAADGAVRGGMALGHDAADLERAGRAFHEPLPPTVKGLLEAGDGLRALRHVQAQVRKLIRAVAAARARRPRWLMRLDAVALAPPIVNPQKIIALGFNYRSHAEEQTKFFGKPIEPPREPVIFAKYASALTGPDGPIRLPPPAVTTQVDYEGELVAVIGRPTWRVSEAEALRHVAGYTIMNDVSARDCQFRDRQWTRAKSCDTFAPCGPWIVTADALARKFPLKLQTRLNGELVQDAATDDMIFSLPYIISYVSRAMTLWPGDLIATGTPAGVGYFRTPQRLLAPGDVVECSIAGIGTLRNPVTG